MSVEAMAYAKLVDLREAEGPSARLLWYVICENTFNDSALCRVGKAELAHQMRASASTVLRQTKALEAEGFIKVHRRPGDGAGRSPDEIEVLGFAKWLKNQRDVASRSGNSGPDVHGSSPIQPVILQDSQNHSAGTLAVPVQPGKMTDRGKPSKPSKTGGGNPSQMTDRYKDSRTSHRTRGARSRAKNSQFDLKVKGGPATGFVLKPTSPEWPAWLAHYEATGNKPLLHIALKHGLIVTETAKPPDKRQHTTGERAP